MPRHGSFNVGFETDRFRPANDIQPMLRPSLAVSRRSQQAIDQCCKCCGCRSFVRAKIIQLFNRRRQADKIERHPPQEYLAVRRRRQLQSLFLKLFPHKIIDRMNPLRYCGSRDGLERPVCFRGRGKCAEEKKDEPKAVHDRCLAKNCCTWPHIFSESTWPVLGSMKDEKFSGTPA